MSEQLHRHDESNKLSIMAAAVEHMQQTSALSSPTVAPAVAPDHQSSTSTSGGDGGDTMMSPSPSRRIKLVLPTLTPAMQQDLALSKGTSGKGSKPLSIGTRPEYADYLLTGIVTPHPNDVLCGRGGGSNNHPGNESFRELVNEVKFPYVNCPKREKPLIARRIVEAVRNQTPPGRFLSKDSKTGMWNDIGDGKAREKTSQALREGAPIIRDMIGKPSSPTNVAHVLKEAKKAERAEKEYGVKLSKGRSPDKSDDASLASIKSHTNMYAEPPHSHSLPLPEHTSSKLKRHKSLGSNNSPHNFGLNHSAPLPPIKKFRSLGEKDILGAQDTITSSAPSHAHPPAPWSHHMPPQQPPPPRNFGMMSPYSSHSGHLNGHMMGGYPPPLPRGPVDYPNSGMPPRHPPNHDSVPIDTVRRLLMGQLDPVQLAMQILPPEEAVMVARRHAAAGGLQNLGMMGRGPVPVSGPATGAPRPLPLAPLVSDGSSTSSSLGSESSTHSIMQRTISDQITSSAAAILASAAGDDASSVDSSKQSNHSENSKRALPKKKRKYIEAKEL